jgi:predicted RNase H-like nuclease (RuvC/YqgF family)
VIGLREDPTEGRRAGALGERIFPGRKTAVMTKFGKCLVVFAVGASFAFLGFAWVSMMGGPNWDAEAAALPEYTIEKSADKWTVKERVGGAAVSVPRSTVEASAIVAAREDLQKKQEAEINRLQQETKDFQAATAEVRKFNAADVKALEARVAELNGQLEGLNTKIMNLSNDVVKRSQEAQAIRTEVTKRREDVFRLTRELREIRADNYRADDMQKRLHDQLVQLNGVELALKSRNKQLRSEVQGVSEPR